MTSTSTIKRFIYIFDVLCTLLAAVLIGFGIYVILTYETDEMASIASYAYMGVGISVIVVLLFLTIGAARENVCCTITFIILMIVVILAQVVVTFLLTKSKESISSNLSNTLDNTWDDEIKNPGAMSHYESWFKCCGRASPQDYIVNGRLPPNSCFENNDSSIPENLIETGCRIKFDQYWTNLLNVFNIVAWVLIGLELIITFISCCLCNSIRNDRRRTYY
ncbi:protein late bloomer [Lucilia sericata]|uniref:protein late bloomer n=1 Tax=Lucilia sericata TaxID=13632 RepID=UPI0018A82801|nr:protein late bloomer [Lucilia sericata]XP_037826379.1 protein late bloomer [Lucilia sericata]XP_037826437.1 protein late bloomer [Lucilia sericata]XP_037826495.1 protein late bloomer [Lucilia sericata]XP_037826556.1 protein late bloomer [Lucilia sericata]XP_037826614.1 protein late bloomer [Lucilia sericata]XP_037826679.1 protein late bloomer [Lucilia sericata]XP_037826744.1 protein late bloomer [Lucilia sericata]